MKLRSLLLVIALYIASVLNAQVFWTEDFQNGCVSDCLASSYVGGNGAWTVTNTGVNGADPNPWYVSGAECGNAASTCGSVCGATDPSLHVGTNASVVGDQGAAYLAGGLGIWFIQTDMRVESPTINCTGQTGITLSFNYIEDIVGQAGYDPGDDATLWYFDGATWTLLDPLTITPSGCNPQGTWTAFSIAMPVSANNNPNVKVGFRWINNDDNIGTDPSFAVDDITLSVPAGPGPTAIFSASDSTICVGDCISFTDLSTGGVIAWGWQFNGTDSIAVLTQDPINICYDTAGTFDVTLVVFDGVLLDTLTMSNFITVNPLPTVTANASPSTTVCSGDMVTLTGGGATAYTWTGGVVDGVPFAATSTTTYVVTGTDGNGCTDTSSITITVNNCSVPTASFIPDSLTICVGGDILFTDNSTGTGITTWVWDFDFTGLGGVVPPTANTQGPHNVTYNTVGTYSVNLSVTDANGTDDTTIIITVVTCTSLNAGFTTSSNNICAGDSVVFTDATTGGTPTIWSWNFDLTTQGGVTPSTAVNQGPHTVFYNNPGTYTVELLVFDGSIFDTITSTITVTDCSPTANFVASQTTLCETGCITFTNLSIGSPTTFLWSFPGGTPATATGVTPGSICYNTAGTYSVTLTVTNQYGADSIVMTNLITVNLCTAPVAGITMNDADGEICVNNCIDFSYDTSLGGTPDSLNWTFEGGTPSTYASNNPTEVITVCWNDTSGNFNVIVSVNNAFGSSTASDSIGVHLEPLIFAGNDTSITIGTDGYLNVVITDTAGNVIPVSGGTFDWTPSSNLTNPNGQSTTVLQPLLTNTYTVTYTDQYGCVVTDNIVITVDIALNIGVPSAFSPDSDINNILYVKGKIVIQTMNFTIYNRYGQKVFETTDKEQGWDGTHNGNKLNPGVFVYYVNVTFIDGSSGQLKGNVTLVR
ncbi:MAG: hypothetical protein COA97_10140 [Flavobacteriales bacterium]|nr:MAG: hypothetical protein COA97_10140 [Flavobacteriales bacterium]